MRIFTSLLVGWLACVAPSSDDGQLHQTEHMHGDFSDVLQIARSGAVDGREKLRTIGENAKDEDVRLAARRIVSLWDNEKRTYFANIPLPLRRDCLDEEALATVRKEIDKATSIELELRITESGEVQTVTILKGSGHLAVDELVAGSLRIRRFLPAKIGDEYRAGNVRVNCRIEVR